MVERFDIYRRITKKDSRSSSSSSHSSDDDDDHQQQQQQQQQQEIIAVDIKIGNKLNGHDGIVHGGVISLLFDEAIGCACECVRRAIATQCQDHRAELPAVTAYLNVDYHSPLVAESEAVLRVYHDSDESKIIGRRKMNFMAKLESSNTNNNNSNSNERSIIYAEARSLFILMKSNL